MQPSLQAAVRADDGGVGSPLVNYEAGSCVLFSDIGAQVSARSGVNAGGGLRGGSFCRRGRILILRDRGGHRGIGLRGSVDLGWAWSYAGGDPRIAFGGAACTADGEGTRQNRERGVAR